VKAKIMVGILLVVVGTALGAAKGFSGDPIPPCKPGVNCPAGAKVGGEPAPPCLPDTPCVPR
jgi:hypothetical protein